MDKNNNKNPRRNFIKNTGLGMGGVILAPSLLSFTEQESVNIARDNKKLGIALVGLGRYSTNQLAPALEKTKNCRLSGIVTGSPSKEKAWKKKYKLPDSNIYNYENFDEIAGNEDIDIVYVVLPISMHKEFTIRAAKAKKHVICEKPMALNAEEAQQMVKACKDNGVLLAIGYRLHFEPFNQRVMELGQQEVFGKVKSIKAVDNSNMTGGSLDLWRLDKERAGGGPLMDLGIYCVQAAIYTMGKPPVAVRAKFGEVTHPAYFRDVEQSITWEMEFDEGVVANCEASYADEEEKNSLSGKAEDGWWKLEPAYSYEGKKGETSNGKMEFPNIYEQVKQMDAQAESFRNNQNPKTPGEMGLRDMKILMAIYNSAKKEGTRVEITY
ncbi:glucose-fructose oxidoreductase [Salegentibacter salinarum]|uniref:Glucose-fructose oxidoreductase n=2 Tax=Salegentibacter salinarum TaxID=447422 RepID=A0A2N0TMF4_9FLAO|nr:glucose-fructose oxidoreductase [Salegentibacter salinarum]